MKDSIWGWLGPLLLLIVASTGIYFWDKDDKNISESASSNSANVVRDDDYSTERSYEEYGDMDCADFGTQAQAQAFFEEQGGPEEDYHNLDRDGDGVVCESL